MVAQGIRSLARREEGVWWAQVTDDGTTPASEGPRASERYAWGRALSLAHPPGGFRVGLRDIVYGDLVHTLDR